MDFPLAPAEGERVGVRGELVVVSRYARRTMKPWPSVMIVPSCWGKSYVTEAARAAIRFGFEDLGLNRIWSYHMVRNPASGRVLAKAGMKREGRLRQHVRKNEVFEDVEAWRLLREDWVKL